MKKTSLLHPEETQDDFIATGAFTPDEETGWVSNPSDRKSQLFDLLTALEIVDRLVGLKFPSKVLELSIVGNSAVTLYGIDNESAPLLEIENEINAEAAEALQGLVEVKLSAAASLAVGYEDRRQEFKPHNGIHYKNLKVWVLSKEDLLISLALDGDPWGLVVTDMIRFLPGFSKEVLSEIIARDLNTAERNRVNSALTFI